MKLIRRQHLRYKGESTGDAARRLGLSRGCVIRNRVARGWPIEKAFNTRDCSDEPYLFRWGSKWANGGKKPLQIIDLDFSKYPQWARSKFFEHRSRGLKSISMDDMVTNYFLGVCSYCGVSGKDTKKGLGVDRIDSTRGYEKYNIQPCCWYCNRAKGDMGDEDFKAHIKSMYKHITNLEDGK